MTNTDFLLSATLLVVSILLLWKGADFFVDDSARVAHRIGVSDLVIGLTLVGLGTSAPEFAVSLEAALRGQADISVGNVVGSNIFNLGFILGGCALIQPIRTERALVYRDGVFLLMVTGLLAFLIFDQHIGRLEGMVMLGLLVGYLLFLFFQRSSFETPPSGETFRWGRDLPLILFGMGMIVGGAHLLVESASSIARYFGMSEWAIGVTIVAAGTSAPEFVTSLNAAIKGRYGMSAGNLIGSDIFNLLGVLGLAATVHPMDVASAGRDAVMLLVVMVGVVILFLRTGWRLSRVEGGVLVGVNLVRWWADMGGRLPM